MYNLGVIVTRFRSLRVRVRGSRTNATRSLPSDLKLWLNRLRRDNTRSSNTVVGVRWLTLSCYYSNDTVTCGNRKNNITYLLRKRKILLRLRVLESVGTPFTLVQMHWLAWQLFLEKLRFGVLELIHFCSRWSHKSFDLWHSFNLLCVLAVFGWLHYFICF